MRAAATVFLALTVNLAVASGTPNYLIEAPNERCHILKYQERVYTDGDLLENYLPFAEITKASVLCAGTVLDIASPIFSNGGDVVLIADHLIIRSPIDTRLHFDHTTFNPYMYPKDAARLYGGRPDSYSKLDTSKHFQSYGGRVHDQRVPRLYAAYYDRPSECVVRSGVKFRPAMLPGVTTVYGPGPKGVGKPGLAPPDEKTNWGAARSGDVYIYARVVEVVPTTQTEDNNAPCENRQQGSPMITVSGVVGGVGGAGLPSRCTGRSTATFDCVDESYRTGNSRNGPGGRGGDAGSIWLMTPSTSAIPSDYFAATEGRPGPNDRLLAPTARGRYAIQSATGVLSDFHVVDPAWDVSESGQSGTKHVRSNVSTTEVVLAANMALRELDIAKLYSIDDLAKRAEADLTIRVITFQDFYQRFLTDVLIEAQTTFLDAQIKQVLSREVRAQPLLPGIFRGINEEVLRDGLLFGETYRQFTEIDVFDSGLQESVIASYMRRTGGLLNIYDKRAYETVLQQAATTKLDSLDEALKRVRGDLVRIERLTNELFVSVERQRLERQLHDLGKALDSAIARAQNSPSTLAKLTKMGKSVAALYGAISSGNWFLAGAAMREVVEDARSLQRGAEFDGEEEALTAAIVLVRQNYSRLLSSAAEVRAQAVFTLAQVLREALANRVSSDKARVFASARFHDLLRAAVLSHLLDGSRNENVLQQNAISVKQLLRGFPDIGSGLRFKELNVECNDRSATYDCKSLRPSSTWREIVVQDSRDPFDGVPLQVLAPSDTRTRYRTLGFKTKVSNISKPSAVDLEDIVLLDGAIVRPAANR